MCSYFLRVILSEREINFLHTVSVDGLEVVAHRDDVVASLTPLFAQLEGFLAIGVVALLVIGNQHKGHRALGARQAVVVHGCVATAIAERKHRYLAYLLANLEDFVGLQVFDDEFIGADNVLLGTHGVVDSCLGALA